MLLIGAEKRPDEFYLRIDGKSLWNRTLQKTLAVRCRNKTSIDKMLESNRIDSRNRSRFLEAFLFK